MRLTIFIILSFFIITYRLFSFDGYYGWDDMAYVKHAVELLRGTMSLTDCSHFVYRWGIIVPLSLCYWLFGINDISTTLPSLFATIGTLYLIYRLTRQSAIEIAALAMLLFALDYYTICYSIRPYADVMLTFFSALMFYPLLKKSGGSQQSHTHAIDGDSVISNISYPFLQGYLRQFILTYCIASEKKHYYFQAVGKALLVASSLLFCFMTKETTVFFIPLLFIWGIYDCYHSQNRFFWVNTVLSIGVLTIIYFAFTQYKTGVWHYRFDRITANYYFNSCSYHLLPFAVLWHRLTTGLLELFVANGMIISMMWAWIGLLPLGGQIGKGIFSRINPKSTSLTSVNYIINYLSAFLGKFISNFTNTTFQWQTSSSNMVVQPIFLLDARGLSLVFVILFFIFHYMSVSYQYYIPMCLDGRHFLPLVPLGALASAPALASFFRYGTYGGWICLIASIAALLSAGFWGDKYISCIYISIALLCWLRLCTYFQRPFIYITLLAILLSVHPIYVMLRPTTTGYPIQTEIVARYLLQSTERQLVISDDLNANLGEYYTHFVKNPSTVFVSYENYSSDLLLRGDYAAVYVLSNAYNNRAIEANGRAIPSYLRQVPTSFEVIANSQGICLYRIPDVCGIY